MSARNSRAAKAARREQRAARSRAPEIGVDGGRDGCPMVPRVPVPVEEMMKRPSAVRVPDEELPPGVAAAVWWWCKDGCGQDHMSVWADTGGA